MVNYQQKIQFIKKYINRLNKQIIYMIILVICLIMGIGFYIGNKFNQETVATKEVLNQEDVKKDMSSAKVIYSVDKDLLTIKNPFTLEHEKREEKNINKNVIDKNNTIENKKQIDKQEIVNKKDKVITKTNKIKQIDDNYKLKAIFNFGNNTVALLNINNKIYRVHQGEQIGNVKILTIEQNKLVLQQIDGKIIDCSLISK